MFVCELTHLLSGHSAEEIVDADLAGYLRAYADKQLTVVLTPRLMQLRRLVIGEVSRFPELAKVLYERGPQRALTRLTALVERLAARGLLQVDDPAVAAAQFNCVIMADPLNRAMLLGHEAIPAPDVLHATSPRACAYSSPLTARASVPQTPRESDAPPARHLRLPRGTIAQVARRAAPRGLRRPRTQVLA